MPLTKAEFYRSVRTSLRSAALIGEHHCVLRTRSAPSSSGAFRSGRSLRYEVRKGETKLRLGEYLLNPPAPIQSGSAVRVILTDNEETFKV